MVRMFKLAKSKENLLVIQGRRRLFMISGRWSVRDRSITHEWRANADLSEELSITVAGRKFGLLLLRTQSTKAYWWVDWRRWTLKISVSNQQLWTNCLCLYFLFYFAWPGLRKTKSTWFWGTFYQENTRNVCRWKASPSQDLVAS